MSRRNDLKSPQAKEETEVLAFSRRGDGHHKTLKVFHEGKPIVVKCYGLKRSWLMTAIRQFGSLLIIGKSSVIPRARCRTEREVIRLWQSEGFDVPRLLPITLPEMTKNHNLVMEWIPGPTLAEVFQSHKVPLARKTEILKRFSVLWGKRHNRVIQLKEPRLLFEHPTFAHIFLSDERLVHFDFELVYTKTHDLERLVRREMVGFLWSLAKTGGEAFPSLLSVLFDSYPNASRLVRVAEELERYGGVPVIPWTAVFHWFFRGRKRFRRRKALGRALKEALYSQGRIGP